MPPSSSPNADLDKLALDWFVRERSGLTRREALELKAWLASAPAHGEALARWRRQWDELDGLSPEVVERLRRQLAADLARDGRTSPSLRPRFSWRLFGAGWAPTRLAAALLVACGASAFAWFQWQQQQPLYAQAFSSERGQQLELKLPAGSRLRLDTATHGEARLFRDRREVRLPQGQAVFDIARDAQRPFDVLAGPLRITVLGTRFAVRYTPSDAADARVHVAVEQGHVRVASAPGSRASVVDLVAGQQVDSDATGRLGPVSAVPADGIAGWRDGRLSFDDAPLAQVLAEFERYAPTGLVLADARTGALRLTGTFDPRRLQNFRRVLPQVLPVRLQERGAQTEIQRLP